MSDVVIESLRQVVADSYAVIGQTHICHWNFQAVDEIAERIRAKGSFAPGGLANLAKMAGVQEIVEDASAQEMVSHLVEANQKLLADLKTARDHAGEAEDSESEDLMIARIQVHEKTVWMLKSFLA